MTKTPLTAVAIVLIVAVTTFLVGIAFFVPGNEDNALTEQEQQDPTASLVAYLEAASAFPTPIPTREGFTPSAPGGDYLDFRDGSRIHLPSDVHHYYTMMDCSYGCPPLPIYTLMRGLHSISIDGNGEILDLDASGALDAFPFLLALKENGEE